MQVDDIDNYSSDENRQEDRNNRLHLMDFNKQPWKDFDLSTSSWCEIVELFSFFGTTLIANPLIWPLLPHEEEWEDDFIPLYELHPDQLGECWIIFAYDKKNQMEMKGDYPVRTDGLVLPCRWRRGEDVGYAHDERLPKSLLRLADTVKKQLAPLTKGKNHPYKVDGFYLHLAEFSNAYLDKLLEDVKALVDVKADAVDGEQQENVGDVESAWGALASGLYLAVKGKVLSSGEWPFSSICYDSGKKSVAGVGWLEQKMSVILDFHPSRLWVSPEQRRRGGEAEQARQNLREKMEHDIGVLQSTCATCEDEGQCDVMNRRMEIIRDRLKTLENLKFVSPRQTQNPVRIAKELALGDDNPWLKCIGLILLVLVIFIVFFIWDSKRTVKQYYADYVDKGGMPSGIFPLKRKETFVKSGHYQFRFRGRHSLFGSRVLQEVVYCNSAGYPQEASAINRRISWDKSVNIIDSLLDKRTYQKLKYDGEGNLSTIIVKDHLGREIHREMFPGGSNTRIDFERKDDGRDDFWSFAQQSCKLFGSDNNSSLFGDVRPEIRTWRIERTTEGYPKRIVFYKDGASKKPLINLHGYCGIEMSHDAQGRVVSLYYLDSDKKRTRLKDGTWSLQCIYNDNKAELQEVSRLSYVIKDNKELTQEMSSLGYEKTCYVLEQRKYQYNLDGNVETLTFHGVNGVSCTEKSLGVAKITLEYDNHGNAKKIKYYGLDNKLCISKEGYAQMIFDYDKQGFIKTLIFLDIKGNRCISKEGYSREDVKYENGLLIENTFFDVNNQICINKYGFSKVIYKYDHYLRLIQKITYNQYDNICTKVILEYYDNGKIKSEAYYDKDKNPYTIDDSGISKIIVEYDDNGNVIKEKFLGTDGNLCISAKMKKTAGFTAEYDVQGYLKSMSYFGTDEKIPCFNSNGYAKQTFKYDEKGNVIQIEYFGIDGNSCLNKEGVAKVTVKYNSFSDMVEMSYWGLDGKLCLSKTREAAIVRRKYDDRGREIEQNYFGTDEAPCIVKGGCTKVIFEYDNNNNKIKEAYYGINDKLSSLTEGHAILVMKYDEFNNKIEESYYDVNKKPCLSKNNGNAISRMKYNEIGKMTEFSFLGINGEPIIDKIYGVAKVLHKYDECGNCWETAFLDTDGNPTIDKIYGASIIRYTNNEKGNRIEEKYFDTEGSQTIDKIHGVSKIHYQYNEYGNKLEEITYFTSDGKATIDKVHGISKISYQFDEHGNQLEEAYFGTDGTTAAIDKIRGISKIRYKYDERGNKLEEVYFNTDGIATIDKVHGISKICYQYDERGNNLEEACFDTDGTTAAIDKMIGISKIRYKYDERGNKLEEVYFNTDGKATIDKVHGISKICYQYDERGKRLEEACLGTDGTTAAIDKIRGISKIRYKYDERGNKLEEVYLDTEGKAITDMVRNISKICYQCDERGNNLEEAFFGIDGKTAVIDQVCGISKIRYKYDERGNKLEEVYFNTDGKATTDKIHSISKICYRYDRYGNLLEETCFGIDGKTTVIDQKSGTSKVRYQYDKRGNRLEEAYFDENGKVAVDKIHGVPRIRYQYDERGNRLKEMYLLENGEPTSDKRNGLGSIRANYDIYDNLIKLEFLNTNGGPANIMFRRLYIPNLIFIPKNNAKPILDNFHNVSKITYKYDMLGNKIEETYLNSDNKACINEVNGISRIIYKYNKSGTILQVKAYNVLGIEIKNLQPAILY